MEYEDNVQTGDIEGAITNKPFISEIMQYGDNVQTEDFEDAISIKHSFIEKIEYEVIVQTGDIEDASTFNDVFIKLVGKCGQSERTLLKNEDLTSAFTQGQVSTFTVFCPYFLGDLLCIELDKQPHDMFPIDQWFLDKVEVKYKEERTFTFPVYCWITDNETYSYMEGTALKGSATAILGIPTAKTLSSVVGVRNYTLVKTETQSLVSFWRKTAEQIRKEELKRRNKNYRWRQYKEGLPYCVDANSLLSLPTEVWFDWKTVFRTGEFLWSALEGLKQLGLTDLANCKENWNDIDEIKRISPPHPHEISKYVIKNWDEDDFFAYQFLNGINPMMIQRCTTLPDKFPVTDDMVSLHGCKLADELQRGNIFLCDYKNLDGLKPNTINGKEQYLMAPLVLLHKTHKNKLMPVAIQLKQTPGNDNPIFVRNDDPDWLMAKTFVRNAEFLEHELNSHLLRTHLLAEVFSLSLLRNIPSMHPLYKLLMPHTRYTLQINILARERLISEDGIFTKFTAACGETMVTILRRSLTSLTYRSLCIRDNIADRGLESVPNFYYRDDGVKLWDIIQRFVQGILEFYYKNDEDVQNDEELQQWIGDIFKYGFLSLENTGIPQKFNTVYEVVKFVTMVIFTCSAQHSAVNTGQYEYGSWMPNNPTSLQVPLPTEEGNFMQKLPNVGTTVNGMATVWLLSQQSTFAIKFGNYPEIYFDEATPCKLIELFQEDLQKLSEDINRRNEKLPIPYTYMDPNVMENSVAL